MPEGWILNPIPINLVSKFLRNKCPNSIGADFLNYTISKCPCVFFILYSLNRAVREHAGTCITKMNSSLVQFSPEICGFGEKFFSQVKESLPKIVWIMPLTRADTNGHLGNGACWMCATDPQHLNTHPHRHLHHWQCHVCFFQWLP